MTDDIVTRLRELTNRVNNETLNRMWATNYDPETYQWLKDYETVRDAADEIERLRKELGLVLAEYQRLEMRYLKAVR